MNLNFIVIVVLVLLLLGSYPAHSYNHTWGYAPFGGVGLVLIVVLLILFLR